ncbi:nucleotidyltransferase family protein [Sphingomonas qomolangmaensis]|uniref:Nucleotidyltransferase family protein n=1 Tax=Sphingomonas qomolangmaensis TaxID=2918765 RepID=A0ABY5LCF1_9SPHN|nr:nucleotidyltransferase family protein [Sphingomonas qomolangmaensis]UUL82366.1 nucleotidyltransferase family protein [Sphingomonas qomolangmaensis]
MEAANIALVTPRLLGALADTTITIPDDAAAFIAFINDRNNDRNENLRAMALDAVTALQTAGMEPVLLKGMAVWATCNPASKGFPRMMSDVDLMIDPSEAEAALEVLHTNGFHIYRSHPPGAPHIVAELWREGGVGLLDLHRYPPGGLATAGLLANSANTLQAPWAGSTRVPTAALQIYLTCLHDMVHDDGFWSGGFDVRHLCDIADLTRAPEGVDWAVVDGLLDNRLLRNKVYSQLIAANRIAGAHIPDAICRRALPRLHFWRHYAQYIYPRFYFPLLVVGVALEASNINLVKAGHASVMRIKRLSKIRSHPNKI